MKSFPLTQADFYKLSHKKFMHHKTEFVYANLTPRSGKYAKWADDDKKVVFFGLQYFIKDFLIEEFNKGFFEKLTICKTWRFQLSFYRVPLPKDYPRFQF